MAERFHQGVSRFSIFCGAVAACWYAVWATISLAFESDSFHHDVLRLFRWWLGGLVVCFFTVWGVIRAVAWVVTGFMKSNASPRVGLTSITQTKNQILPLPRIEVIRIIR